MAANFTESLKKDSSTEAVNGRARLNRDKTLKIIIIHQGMTRSVLPLLNSRHKIIGIIESAPRQEPGPLLKFAKSVYGFVNPRYRTLKKLSKSYRVPYYYMSNGCDEHLADWVRKLSPDLIAIHTMAQLLKPNIFSIPKLGAINLHQSCLPAYRGPEPDFWQYHDMELNPGVTVHYIDQGEDTGDIIFQTRTPIALGTKSPERLDKLVGDVGVGLLLKALDAIADSSAPRIAQPAASPTARARKIKYDEHKNIIDWNEWQIERIWHLLRGTEQWFNAIEQPDGIYQRHRWSIEEYVKCDATQYSPSRIYRKNGRYFVACSDGKIFLSKRFSIKKFLSRFW